MDFQKLGSRAVKPPRFIHDEEHADASKAIIESSHHDLYQRPWNQQLAVSTSTTFEHGEGETCQLLHDIGSYDDVLRISLGALYIFLRLRTNVGVICESY